jgi:hypothetical protein
MPQWLVPCPSGEVYVEWPSHGRPSELWPGPLAGTGIGDDSTSMAVGMSSSVRTTLWELRLLAEARRRSAMFARLCIAPDRSGERLAWMADGAGTAT